MTDLDFVTTLKEKESGGTSGREGAGAHLGTSSDSGRTHDVVWGPVYAGTGQRGTGHSHAVRASSKSRSPPVERSHLLMLVLMHAVVAHRVHRPHLVHGVHGTHGIDGPHGVHWMHGVHLIDAVAPRVRRRPPLGHVSLLCHAIGQVHASAGQHRVHLLVGVARRQALRPNASDLGATKAILLPERRNGKYGETLARLTTPKTTATGCKMSLWPPLKQVSGAKAEGFVAVGIPAEVTARLGGDGGAVGEGESVEGRLCVAIVESCRERAQQTKGDASMQTKRPFDIFSRFLRSRRGQAQG